MSSIEYFSDFVYSSAPKTFTDALPNLAAKYKDYISLKGKHLSYTDFTRFFVKNGYYTPLLALSDNDWEESDVVDLLPAICVGCAEIASALDSMVHADISYSYLYRAVLLTKPLNFITQMRLFNSAGLATYKTDDSLDYNLLFSLKTPFLDSSFEQVKDIANVLFMLAKTDQRLFTRMVVDLAYVAYACIPAFIGVANIPKSIKDNVDMFGLRFCMTSKPKDYWKFKAVGYEVANTKYWATDGRGFSIMLTCLFFGHLYNLCAEQVTPRTVIIPFDQSVLKMFNNRINECIGDDWVGKFISNRPTKLRKSVEDSSILYHLGINQTTTVKVGTGSEKVLKDLYESNLFASKACGVKRSISIPTCYSSPKDIYNAIHIMYEKPDNYIASKYVDKLIGACSLDGDGYFISFDDSVAKKYLSMETSDDAELLQVKSELRQKTVELEAVQNRLKKLESDFESERKLLQHQLDNKSEIITNLSEEIIELNREISSYYSDDEPNLQECASQVTLETAINAIKPYKILLVGGHFDMLSKLAKYGLDENIRQVFDLSKINGENTDFICVNTTFTSHSLISRVKAEYTDFLEKLFYFNGTNVEVFIRSAYDFLMKRLGDEE